MRQPDRLASFAPGSGLLALLPSSTTTCLGCTPPPPASWRCSAASGPKPAAASALIPALCTCRGTARTGWDTATQPWAPTWSRAGVCPLWACEGRYSAGNAPRRCSAHHGARQAAAHDVWAMLAAADQGQRPAASPFWLSAHDAAFAVRDADIPGPVWHSDVHASGASASTGCSSPCAVLM